MAVAGGTIPDRHNFVLRVDLGSDAALFSVSWGLTPVATYGLAWTDTEASKVWPLLEKQYLEVTDLLMTQAVDPQLGALVSAEAKEPDSLPWLGVVLYHSRTKETPPDIRWLPEFERSIAWAILAERANETGLSNEECHKL